jgi:hypothetical protein
MKNKFWLSGLIALICFAQGGPVGAQGGPPAQNVNVVNTPTVNVGSIAISTVKIFEEFGGGISDPIDVSPFKQIRIVARCASPGGPMTVRPFTMYGNTTSEVAALGDIVVDCTSGSTATYDTPGQKLIVQVIGSGAVVVYGRTN